ncbi:MAG: hypothetical protein Q4G27_09105 [Flavobacteriaceae bacterium]|nr:hypothetical protein [Flavobacteriaceae bacterium]
MKTLLLILFVATLQKCSIESPNDGDFKNYYQKQQLIETQTMDKAQLFQDTILSNKFNSTSAVFLAPKN